MLRSPPPLVDFTLVDFVALLFVFVDAVLLVAAVEDEEAAAALVALSSDSSTLVRFEGGPPPHTAIFKRSGAAR